MENKIVLIEKSEIEIREKFTEAAKSSKTLFYSDLRLEKDSCQMTRLMKILNRIGKYEIQNGRPPLCAIVVRKKKVKGKRTPGKGFEKLCLENGPPVYEGYEEDYKNKCLEEWRKNDD
ncbi:MAG: hypothetical protein ACRCUJ_01600 [Phocaeicola sp.]